MTITSKEVAEMLGKRHDNLLRAIRKYITQLGDEAPKYFSEDPDKGGRLYHITKAGCDLMAGRIIGAQSEAFKTKYAPELAKVLEVPPTTVNGWMRGAHLPDIEKLMEICDYLEMPVGEMLGDHRHINDLDEVKHLMDVSLKQKAYIENLEAELNECKMLNNQLMSDLDADEGLAEICVNEFIADTIKAVKDAGVKKITVEF